MGQYIGEDPVRLFHTVDRRLIASILSLQGLSPQLIILRVAMGHAWTKNSVSVRVDDRMEFQKRSTTAVGSGNSESFRLRSQ